MKHDGDKIVNSLGAAQPLKNMYYIVVREFRRWMTTIWALSILNLGYFDNSAMLLVLFPFLWDVYKTPKSIDLSMSEITIADALLGKAETPGRRQKRWSERILLLAILLMGFIVSYSATQSFIGIDITRIILTILSFFVVGYVSLKSTDNIEFMYDGLDKVRNRIRRHTLPAIFPLLITIVLYATCLAIAWTAFFLQEPRDQPIDLFPIFLIDSIFFICIGLMTAWIPTYHFILKVNLIAKSISGDV